MANDTERQPPKGYRVHFDYVTERWEANADMPRTHPSRNEATDACEQHKAMVNEDIARVFGELSTQYLRERDEARASAGFAWQRVETERKDHTAEVERLRQRVAELLKAVPR
jgi:hypothetical protein